MIAYVAGHTHANRSRFFRGRHGHGFWQINTASHIDWPEQARLIEIMDNRDGTLSLFGTMLDSAAPVAAPAPGPGERVHATQLASLARTLAVQRPAGSGLEGSAGGGSKAGTPQGPQRRAAREGPR